MTASQSPRPSGPRYTARRDAIVDLAAELFAKNGYAATGIREIGDAAQLARGALYYYIESKESLLSEIHDRVMDPLLEQTRSIVALNVSATTRMRMLSEVLLTQVVGHRDHVWVFLHEHRALAGERREIFRRKRSEYEHLIISLFDDGVANGEFEIADTRITMLAFLNLHNYTYQWVRSEPGIDPKKLSDLYCDVFLFGIVRGSVTTSDRSATKTFGHQKASVARARRASLSHTSDTTSQRSR